MFTLCLPAEFLRDSVAAFARSVRPIVLLYICLVIVTTRLKGSGLFFPRFRPVFRILDRAISSVRVPLHELGMGGGLCALSC